MSKNFNRAQWTKSNRSQQNTDQCVEVAAVTGQVGVRDSKNPDGPKLRFAPREWAKFARDVKAGGHDL